jgi:hypothetical protein
MVQSQPRKIVSKTLSQKNSSLKRDGRVAQGVGPEFKLQYPEKKKTTKQNPVLPKKKKLKCYSSLPIWGRLIRMTFYYGKQ